MRADASPRLTLLLIPPATAAAVLIGFALGSAWIFPLICALPACTHLWRALSRGRRAHALAGVMVWAASLGACCTTASFLQEDRAARVILNGPAYAQEMRAWIATGEGRESSPARFVPQHLLHLAIFSALAAATAGAAALAMGSVLMAYMSFHVGTFAASAPGCSPAIAALLAWNPWSLVRIASYIVLGVVLAEPLVAAWRTRRGKARRAPERMDAAPLPAGRSLWIAVALAGVLADMLLKALLAPAWRTLLASCVAP